MERFTPNDSELPPPEREDFLTAPYYHLIKKIPDELIQKHLIYIEENQLNPQEATEYLEDVLELRSDALTETVISDETILEKIKNQKEAIFRHLETDVFSSQENYLGSGMTAKVKYFEIEDLGTKEVLPIAVKYLVTPTEMTLSASSEHDMLLEVERIQKIEDIEADAQLTSIKVPHPYFHHQNAEIQCYAMELVDGVDLSKKLGDLQNGDKKEALINAIASVDIETVFKEVEIFFNRMHEYCLHGDMKQANMMVDSQGTFFVIDFGQSRLVTDIPDNAREQLYTLQEDEIAIAKRSIRTIVEEAKSLLRPAKL